jgi:hypothetical protein
MTSILLGSSFLYYNSTAQRPVFNLGTKFDPKGKDGPRGEVEPSGRKSPTRGASAHPSVLPNEKSVFTPGVNQGAIVPQGDYFSPWAPDLKVDRFK